MTAQDVEQVVILPMIAALPSPTHVRHNLEATETLLNVYRRALACYDAPVLRLAWQKAAAENDMWLWPKVTDLVAAAEHFHKLTHPTVKPDDGWAEKARQMADAYWQRYSKCTAAVRARESGYEPRLREFVLTAASVQAQVIMGRGGYAYEGTVLFQLGETREERDAWFREAEAQGRSGEIRVLLPKGLTAKWRQEVQRGLGR